MCWDRNGCEISVMKSEYREISIMEKLSLARDKISQAYLGTWGGEKVYQKARKRIDWLAKNALGPQILDVGCSEGILAILLAREGNIITGIDVNPDSLAYARSLLQNENNAVQNRVTFQEDNLFSLQHVEHDYNTVIIAEVIEHLYAPKTAINNVVSRLKPAGRILLTTPFGYFPDPDHHQTFSVMDVIQLLRPLCTLEHVSVIDGYIRIIACKDDKSIKNSNDYNIQNILDITERAAIEEQIRSRQYISELINENKKLKEKNNQINLKNKDLTKNIINEKNKYREHYFLLEQKISDIKKSFAWKIGYVTVLAFRHPGKNTILWLPRLAKIFLKSTGRENQGKISKKKCHKSRNQQYIPIITIKEVFPITFSKNRTFHAREGLLKGDTSRIKIACVMDEFTYNCFAPTCSCLSLTLENCIKEITEYQPDLLFIESAWNGNNGSWQKKISNPDGELNQLIAWCNKKGIPTAFWNKEDPPHFNTFINTAKLFDFIFTTDIDCIAHYKKILKNERIYLLLFAAQPKLHNPIEKHNRRTKCCFAGAYYPRYPERIHDFNVFFDMLCNTPGFDIYDRNYNDPSSEFIFPEKFKSHILGTLPNQKIDVAYKGYKYGINMNSIKQSPSMFARRVFELIASNTIVVSNFSKGTRLLFGDTLISTDNGKNLNNQLSKFDKDELYYKKIRLLALRKILTQHTYTNRLSYIAKKVWNISSNDTLPKIHVIGFAKTQSHVENIISSFDRQTYRNKKLQLILYNNIDFGCLREDINIIIYKDVNRFTLVDIVSNGYCACFHPKDYYGKNYLLDIILSTKYTDAAIIGKKTFNILKGNSLEKIHAGHEYSFVDALPFRSAIIKYEILCELRLTELESKINSEEIKFSSCFSVDEFNYCKNFMNSECSQVEDLEGVSSGIDMHLLEDIAENIQYVKESHMMQQLNGYELANLIHNHFAQKIRCKKKGDHLNIQSTLNGDETIQLASKKYICFENRDRLNELTIHVETSPRAQVRLIVWLLDASKGCIKHEYISPNMNYDVSSGIDFNYIQLGLEVSGVGNFMIYRIVFDYLPASGPYIATSDKLLVTHNYPTYEKLYQFAFVHTRVRLYNELNTNVDVLSLNNKKPEKHYEFNNINVLSGPSDTLEKALSNGKYSVVLVHYLTQEMWSILRNYVHTLPIILWLHGAEVQPWHRRKCICNNDAEELKARELSDERMQLWKDVFTTCNNSQMHFVFVSHYFAKNVMEDYQITLPKKSYSIIHNSIDTRLFKFKPKSVDLRKRILSIRPFASRIYANDLTVKAILLLSEESFFDDLEFRIIGKGALFETTLEPLRMFDNVIIEKRFLQQNEISKLHHQYGIFLSPSRMDSQGVSRDEAMASGLVPITNNVAAIPEFVDEHCGILTEPEDFKGIAEGIKRLYYDPDLFSQLSQNAAKRVEGQSSFNKTIQKEISLINSRITTPHNF